MAKRRIQIEIDDPGSQTLDALQKNTDSTITELIRNSIALYDWAVEESKNNRLILSVSEMPRDQNVTKPILKGINTVRGQ